MEHQTDLFRGIFKPKKLFKGYGDTVTFYHFKRQFFILLLISGVLMATGSALKGVNIGFGLAGNFIGGMIGAFIGLIVISFFYKLFFWDVDYKSIFVIQTYLTVIIMMVSFLNDVVTILFHLNVSFDYTTLAAVGLIFTQEPHVLSILSLIGISVVWSCYVQIIALFEASNRSKGYIITVIVGVQVLIIGLNGMALSHI